MDHSNTNGVADSAFHLGNFSIDEHRPMKVVVVGAGYSGIIAGIRFLQKVKNIDLTIYEAAAGVGGAWFHNKYPGLTCDIPSHCYQLTFAVNPHWSSFYASGPEILTYLESVVDKYKLMPYIKLQHRMMRGRYSEAEGKWRLTIQRPVIGDSGEVQYEEVEDTCDVLFTGTGTLHRWSWPDIPGLNDFRGQIIHSAAWETGEGGPNAKWQDSVASWGPKSVGVIGVGSSAIQLVPALQPRVKNVVNFVRGQTWIAANFVREHIVKMTGDENKADNYVYTEEQKAKFAEDPEYYRQYRKEIESDLNSAHAATLRGNPLQIGGKAAFTETMKKRLAKKPWIANHIIPDFGVACRRLTPGPGYLEALCEDNVDFVPTGIERVTPTGIQTTDGKLHELDVLICATGFDITGHLPFDLIGRNGVTLESKYTPHPRTYMSVAVDGFPNWFQGLGPNSGVGAGSLLLLAEREVDYAVAATLKLQRERLKSIEARPEAVADFDEYIDSYFPTTVFGEKCRSWYKAGKEEGRVVALWPGSCTHAARALANPRWEDFTYERLPKSKNRFHWLGDGNTVADRIPEADKAWYLDASEIDIPPVPLDR
ncbi:FAD/NAD(P)-binding domain-containing protein [Hymenopellis radicata]|nr:FAD/NAD(P)-binding domain-containing protein [Hymenopellis radicata]